MGLVLGLEPTEPGTWDWFSLTTWLEKSETEVQNNEDFRKYWIEKYQDGNPKWKWATDLKTGTWSVPAAAILAKKYYSEKAKFMENPEIDKYTLKSWIEFMNKTKKEELTEQIEILEQKIYSKY
jgi:hypothetical protein